MYQIKFGTDGWREIIADEFTVANVRRVANATALWLSQSDLPKVALLDMTVVSVVKCSQKKQPDS